MDKKEKKRWVPYWNQKTPDGEWKMYARRKGAKYDREDKQILAFLIFGVLLIIVMRRIPIPAGYHWQDDIPARFGLSLGKFVFYSLLIEGLGLILVIVAMLHWRRKKNVARFQLV